MKSIDDYWLLKQSVPISKDTPNDISLMVRVLKAMVQFNDADLDADRQKLINFFLNRVNTMSWGHLIWGMEIKFELVESLYDRAVKWIKEVELK